MTKKSRLFRTIVGLLLVFTGTILLLSNFGVIESVGFIWDIFFLVLGGYLYFIAGRKKVVFEGLLASFLFPLGLIGLLAEFQIIPFGMSIFWPITLSFFGCYLIFLFFYERVRMFFITGCSFFSVGILLLLKLLGIITISYRQLLLRGWPIAIVILGLYILKGIIERKDRKKF